MATDSTELTFVRCPSCRSLVPAVSSRCRMCGAGLDADEELARDASAEDAGESDVAAPEEGGKVSDSQRASDNESSDDDEDDFVDPLGDYLRDFDDSDGEDDADEESSEEESEKGKSESPEEVLQASPSEDESDAQQEKSVEKSEREGDRRPKLTVESGKGKGTLSFRKEGEEGSGKAGGSSTNRKRERPDLAPPRSRRARSEREGQDSGTDKQGSHNEVTMKHALATPSSEDFSQKGTQEGKLFGWLVSFKERDGKALELREGKFFVTGSSLKKNDLVLKNSSVSTPHALVSISVDRGLLVQDLMSENGVFLLGANDDNYQREEETVRLEHGDSVRFGDEEFLVSLLPVPRRR
ncbi:FHA domain-containing protein [bacterium]|nr:FHA domain-containing protein [bacterium]